VRAFVSACQLTHDLQRCNVLSNLSDAELGRLVRIYELEINHEEGDDIDPPKWACFPGATGGVWGYGCTLDEAVLDCLESNELKRCP
jgi:hypothetical protein